ncbi:MAG: replication initiator protein [Microvirus sp.]|nr:MAG: replication initiator protein [Microvirus sp.]
MTCYTPVTLYKSRMGPDKLTGRWPVGGFKDGYIDMPVPVACGRCLGCRLERSRQWAIRCEHEKQMHKESAFITLTYRNEDLKFNFARPTLFPEHLTNFFKRYRKKYGKLRYFACGEYGSRTNRPHYHAIIFGHDFEDKKFHKFTEQGHKTYNSDSLNRLWTHGDCLIGDVTFESIAYVARYIMDKKLGETASYYEQHAIEPEFVRMSRRPGIGSDWYDKYQGDVFPHDRMIIRGGIETNVPRYYTEKQVKLDPEKMKGILKCRQERAKENYKESTPKRLFVREQVKRAQIRSLQRHKI